MGQDGTVRRRVTFFGRPLEARVLVLTLQQYGVEVRWEPPPERLGPTGAVERVRATVVAAAPEEEIRHAVAKFEQRLPGADVEIEDDHLR